MSNIAHYVSVLPVGATLADRQLDVARRASEQALAACIDMKGKVGGAIRAQAAGKALAGVITQAVNGNYRPFAELLALRTGEPVIIGSKSTFEAMPDMYQMKVEAIRATDKDKGVKSIDPETGLETLKPKMEKAINLHRLVQVVVTSVREAREAAKASAAQETSEVVNVVGLVEA